MKSTLQTKTSNNNSKYHNIIRFPSSQPDADSYIGRFSFSDVKVLIVCRGPIRKEALEVFEAMGCQPSGILLSEKDSVVYRLALSPEVRMLNRERDIHHVTDYMGTGGKEEKIAVINQIIGIAKSHGYTHLFAGYGFMAEDEEFVAAIEAAGLGFIGPAASVIAQAGAKDEAKKIARSVDISVTPGVDNITARTLAAKASADVAKLKKLAADAGLKVPDLEAAKNLSGDDLFNLCDKVLQAGYDQKVDLISIEEIQKQALVETETIWKDYPGYRIRLKYIGGGGGKGQRVVGSADQVADAVKEVLVESKMTGTGDNKNFLIELNIEDTRHNEIQVLGNGEWCISLGGRDCSLQMHEQKLVEISITDELYAHEIERTKAAGLSKEADRLAKDKEMLKKMEEQSVRFGEAVGLNSASTWECIVDDKGHYFMEMNTRIQVEHRVTELAYSLKFQNPDNADDYFIIESLVAAMLLVGVHGKAVPKPEIINRHMSGCEVRLNATNKALQPHAGGILTYWSEPHELEIRDDQGIGLPNPDTGRFIKYNLAGAYDSNAALTLSWGEGRTENLANLINVLRVMDVRGIDVETNLSFQYGILNWMYGKSPMARPNTQFTYSYLAGVGALQDALNSFDPQMAFGLLYNQHSPGEAGGQAVLAAKKNLIVRPLEAFCKDAHQFAGWLGRHEGHSFNIDSGKVNWLKNPVQVLDDLYWYCRLEEREAAPQHKIWPEDEQILKTGRAFYAKLAELDEDYLSKLNNGGDIAGTSREMEQLIRASHNGHNLGLELLNAMILLAEKSGFMGFGIDSELHCTVPDQFKDREVCAKMVAHLAPKPEASTGEIRSWTGGTFYACETPGSPAFINEGEHFEKGQPLGILEVMKMFNKIPAPFSGTVKKVMVDGMLGQVVSKGQVIFEVEPDVEIKVETPEEKEARIKSKTEEAVKAALA